MKNNVRFGIIIAILLIIYHLLVFILPFEHNGIFWLSYGFTLDAFVIAAVACVIAFRNGKDVTSKFYGFPIAKVGISYLAVQLILCFVFMTLSLYFQIWLGALVYTIALGAAVIGLVATDTVRDHIEIQDIKLNEAISVMRSAQSKVNQMVAQCDNAGSASLVKALAEELRYSDPVSNSALVDVETDLCSTIDELQQAVVDGDDMAIKQLCHKGTATLNERNRLCKLYKK